MVSGFRRSTASPWLYCLPAIAILAAVAAYPLWRTLLLSLTDAKLGAISAPHWVGLVNFSDLLRDPDWWHSVWNTLVFTVISVAIETVLGLAIALLLNAKFRGRGALRAAVLVPWAIPAVVSARLWAWMFNDLYGVINHALRLTGLASGQTAWLASDRLALGVLVAVDVWKTTPFMALLLLAGLQSIPQSLLEAARVDGASPLQEFLGVTLPLLKPALWVAVLFRALDALRIFDLPFVLTSSSRATQVMSIYARQQLVDFQDLGYGSAACALIFFSIGALAALYLILVRSSLERET